MSDREVRNRWGILTTALNDVMDAVAKRDKAQKVQISELIDQIKRMAEIPEEEKKEMEKKLKEKEVKKGEQGKKTKQKVPS